MVISISLQKALWQWHKERGEHACICVRVWKCECMHWAGGCRQRWLFSLSIFLHNHITPTLKTDTCICNIQTRRMVLLLSLNFICGFWNHCNYDQPNTHLPNKAIFCVCVCVCACVGKDIHACTCMLHAAEWVLFFPPLHLIVQFGSRLRDENPDLMSRQANRNEECIGAVMWEDGPMSPWGIRVLSYRR